LDLTFEDDLFFRDGIYFSINVRSSCVVILWGLPITAVVH